MKPRDVRLGMTVRYHGTLTAHHGLYLVVADQIPLIPPAGILTDELWEAGLVLRQAPSTQNPRGVVLECHYDSVSPPEPTTPAAP